MPTAASLQTLRLNELQSKISWICQAIRWLAIVWLAWVLYLIANPLMDMPQFLERINASPTLSLLPATLTGAMANRAVVLVDWLCAATIGVATWRLMATYLSGEIFSQGAALGLKRVGQAALLATLADIILRPLATFVLSPALLMNMSPVNYFHPQDLLYVLISAFILSLAHIYQAAAEINAENKGFI